jgi:threonine/homoserine/homoserine lactone efflux protein
MTMINLSLLAVFIPTCFMISLTPGMCMTLSLTLGMSIGVRRTFWMMWGELSGVALVSIAAVAGVATIMLNYPALFVVLKYVGGAYLLYLGVQLFRSRGRMALSRDLQSKQVISRRTLAGQGFLTAVSNPKGWAFTISLLPPFIDRAYPIIPQMSILLIILLAIELICLIIYARGGRSLGNFLDKKGGTGLLNKTAGTLMIGVSGWLVAG